MGGRYLLNRYGGLREVLQIAYPDLPPSKLPPTNHWKTQEFLREFLNKIQQQYQIQEASDWHNVTRAQIREAGGSGLLSTFGSITGALRAAYPDKEWSIHPIHASSKPTNFWKDQIKVRQLFEDAIKQWELNHVKDLSSIPRPVFTKAGFAQGLTLHNGVTGLLRFAFPEIDWSQPRKPPGYWLQLENVQHYAKQVESAFSLSDLTDWYRISREQLESVEGGSSILKRYGFTGFLRLVYPQVEWIQQKLDSRAKKSTQFWLKKQVGSLFPGMQILEDYRHPQLRYQSGAAAELDLFLPQLNLAFEYQGEQHYHDLPMFGPLELYRLRDSDKVQLCADAGIKLVIVPYWWDKRLSSLGKLLHNVVPHLSGSELSAR